MVSRGGHFPNEVIGIYKFLENKEKKDQKTRIKNSTTGESVVELVQNAKQVRIPSPPRPDIKIGYVSIPDPRICYYEYKQERERSV